MLIRLMLTRVAPQKKLKRPARLTTYKSTLKANYQSQSSKRRCLSLFSMARRKLSRQSTWWRIVMALKNKKMTITTHLLAMMRRMRWCSTGSWMTWTGVLASLQKLGLSISWCNRLKPVPRARHALSTQRSLIRRRGPNERSRKRCLGMNLEAKLKHRRPLSASWMRRLSFSFSLRNSKIGEELVWETFKISLILLTNICTSGYGHLHAGKRVCYHQN